MRVATRSGRRERLERLGERKAVVAVASVSGEDRMILLTSVRPQAAHASANGRARRYRPAKAKTAESGSNMIGILRKPQNKRRTAKAPPVATAPMTRFPGANRRTTCARGSRIGSERC